MRALSSLPNEFGLAITLCPNDSRGLSQENLMTIQKLVSLPLLMLLSTFALA
jgi:hypothetical protein